MASVRIGSSLSALSELPDSPSITTSTIGTKVVRTYNIDYASAQTVVGALSYGDADADYSDSKLRESNIRNVGPTNAIVTLTYVPNEWGATEPPESLPPVGTITKEIDANPIMLPIEQNANVSASDIDQGRKQGKGDLAGIDGFLSPQPIYTRTEILGSYTFSEANAIDNVARVFTTAQMATQGLSGATTLLWLKVGLNVRTVGDKYEKTERWQYAENGWNAKYLTAT
jgi:hypothetical protein